MLTRVHISSFVGLTIFVWLIALWVQGTPVLDWDFVRPFGIVVGAISTITIIFNRYAWAWRIFRGWYVKRPDLRGTWKVTLISDWIDPGTGKQISPIVGYVAIRQTLTHLSMRLMTKESRSTLVAHSIAEEEDGLFRLAAVYRNEPQIELQGARSEIHHGALNLEIFGSPPDKLEGHYWTDRKTRGSIVIDPGTRKVYDTFESAESAIQ